MPCWTVKTTSVNVDKMDMDILEAGLRADSYAVKRVDSLLTFSRSGSSNVHSYLNGKMKVTGNEVDADVAMVKRAYSSQLVKVAAMKNGWKFNENKGEKTVSFTLTSRR